MKRGEVHLIDFGTPRGSEPSGIRPALILQNDVGNQFSTTTIVAAITSSGTERVYPVEVRVNSPEGGLKRRSTVDLALLLTVDKTRSARVLGALRPETMQLVDRALRISLSLAEA